MTRLLRLLAAALVLVPAWLVVGASVALAAPNDPDITIDLPNVTGEEGPSNALIVLLALTVMALLAAGVLA